MVEWNGGRGNAPARCLRALLALLALTAGLLAPARPTYAAPAPRDPSGGRPAVRVVVAQGGMQQIGAAALSAAGLDPAQAEALQLWRDGVPVAIEQQGSDADLTLRFFAPTPGDRWNEADTYWLTLEDGPGLRMGARSVVTQAAQRRAAALERGLWRDPQTYDPGHPGPLGEHWFSADLRTNRGQPAATLPITFSADLPLATGALSLTVRGTAVSLDNHALDVTVGDVTLPLRWSGAGDFAHTLSFPAGADGAALALVPREEYDQVQVSEVAWERQASLTVGVGGAAFVGLDEAGPYQLTGLPAGAALYDVSDPARPVILTGVAGGAFEDVGGRSYVLATPAGLRQPRVEAYGGLALPAPAKAIYIAPASLHSALSPLVGHRRAQGYSVAVVDVQAIYDAWSYGQVDPEAIRSFLAHAWATWDPRPLAATLVGDGTVDPHDYQGLANVNLVPPYMALVDRRLGETACEMCYGLVDGASPLDDVTSELAIGRLPVKSEEELTRVVARLVAYDQPGGSGWRSRAVLVADNGYEASGAPDPAGDFAAFLDAVAAQLPVGMQAQRIYYDPWQRDANNAPLGQPWRLADGGLARSQLLAALNAGAGLVVYAGHASHWQWASTGPPQPPGEQQILGLYDPDGLRNGGRLPIVLGMTCLTSGFHQPAFGGSVLDERMFLSEQGGAIAVWGPTGLEVAHGHDALARGFLAGLRAGAGRATLGELTLAGYSELREDYLNGKIGDVSALRTYALLGDPLMPARVQGAERVLLPFIGK